MKMFKKLAAVALAAVLALSMVGCGAGGTGSSYEIKNSLVNGISDSFYTSGKSANYNKDIDTLASDLIEDANNVTLEDAGVATKLVQAAAAEKYNGYIVCYAQAPTTPLKTSAMQAMYAEMVASYVESSVDNVNENAKAIDFGLATGEIDDVTYIVVLAKVVA